MKKLAAMLMALMMLLTMAACGQQAPEQTGGTVEPGAQSDDAVTGQVDTPAPDEDTPENETAGPLPLPEAALRRYIRNSDQRRMISLDPIRFPSV